MLKIRNEAQGRIGWILETAVLHGSPWSRSPDLVADIRWSRRIWQAASSKLWYLFLVSPGRCSVMATLPSRGTLKFRRKFFVWMVQEV